MTTRRRSSSDKGQAWALTNHGHSCAFSPRLPIRRMVLVNPKSDVIYTSDYVSAEVSVLHGSKRNAEVASGCTTGVSEQRVGSAPLGLCLNTSALRSRKRAGRTHIVAAAAAHAASAQIRPKPFDVPVMNQPSPRALRSNWQPDTAAARVDVDLAVDLGIAERGERDVDAIELHRRGDLVARGRRRARRLCALRRELEWRTAEHEPQVDFLVQRHLRRVYPPSTTCDSLD